MIFFGCRSRPKVIHPYLFSANAPVRRKDWTTIHAALGKDRKEEHVGVCASRGEVRDEAKATVKNLNVAGSVTGSHKVSFDNYSQMLHKEL